MCIVLLSHDHTPGYQLILAANRDEFCSRPTAPLNWWEDNTAILAGRDLQDGGTWLGVTREGKYGVLTNYREFPRVEKSFSSRGEILVNYFGSSQSPGRFIEDLQKSSVEYRGFNLLIGEGRTLYYYSNRNKGYGKVEPGVHGLSNHLLNSPWPKVVRGKELFGKVVGGADPRMDDLFELLGDTRQPGDHELPDTGVGRTWERMLAPIFISSEDYGTRSSALLTITDDGIITLRERTYSIVHNGSETEAERCFTIKVDYI